MVSQYKGHIKCYRIADSRHPIFSGYGAQRVGGRWNSVGKSAIYASINLSCAMLELRLHLNNLPLPHTHKYIEIISNKEISVEEMDIDDLKAWNVKEDSESKEYGNQWLEENRSLILIVPSIIIPQEKNVVINPCHPEFKKLKISKPLSMKWDKRLF